MFDMKEVLVYLWLLAFSFVVGILSFLKRSEKRPFKVGAFTLGVLCSMVAGYITFEAMYYIFGNERFAIALAGVGAWMGTDTLLSLESVFKEIITRRLK